jgi:hypothetical protein
MLTAKKISDRLQPSSSRIGTAKTLAAHVRPMPKKVVRKPTATMTQP